MVAVDAALGGLLVDNVTAEKLAGNAAKERNGKGREALVGAVVVHVARGGARAEGAEAGRAHVGVRLGQRHVERVEVG